MYKSEETSRIQKNPYNIAAHEAVSVCLCVCLRVCVCVCLSVCLSVSQSVRPSVFFVPIEKIRCVRSTRPYDACAAPCHAAQTSKVIQSRILSASTLSV